MTLRKPHFTALFLLLVCALVILGASTATAQCVSLTGGTYTQNFDTLSNVAGSTTNDLTIAGWYMTESGGSARDNEQYAVDTGSSNTGDTYSYGAAGSTNRALGGLQSGTLIPVFGACFTNNTGATLSSITIQYTGKQFRVGTANRTDQLDFKYSTDATSLSTGTWTDVNELDYVAPQSATTGVVANPPTTNLGPQVITVSLANGATIWVRWNDLNASGADDGLAIDDFMLTAGGAPVTTNPAATGTATPVTAGETTTFDGTITPGTNPNSLSYTVTCNLSGVSGSKTYGLTVSGTTISGTYTVPNTVAPKTYSLPCVVTDDQARSGSFNISLTVAGQPLTIMQIQGSGSYSPHAGESVQTTGVVYDLSYNGYWIQDTAGDGDPSTSDGIFVFTSSAPKGIAVGDLVTVAGKVSEYAPSGDPSASPMTEIVQPATSVNSHGNALPEPWPITAADIDPDGGIDQLERYEGMRVHIDTLTVVAPTDGTVNEANATGSNNGVFFGVLPGQPRPFRKEGIELPATPPGGSCDNIPCWNGAPQRIRVDTDVISATLGNGLALTSGVVVSNLTGPLDFSQHAYTIITETLPVQETPNISAVAVPAPDASEFTVASFNMQRFFDTVNDPGVSDTVLTATAFANRLNKASLAIRNVMMTPDIIGVEEMENLSTLQTLAAKVNGDAVAAGQPDPGYTAYLEEGNDIGGIDVGFLVKSRVTVNSVTQAETGTFVEPDGTVSILNDRPPLVLDASVTNQLETTHFLAIVVHQRSLSGVDDPQDGRVREKRRAQAEFLANLIQSFQAKDPNAKIVTVGDFNAFEVNDGYVDVMGTVNGTPTRAENVVLASPDLVDPNMIDLATTLPAEERYSYINYGTSQTLDHAIVNPGMFSIFSRFAYARNNADFPETYRGDATRPERISDHDMEVAYFKLPVDHTPPVVTVTGVVDGDNYLLGSVPVAGCTTVDSYSPIKVYASVSITGGTANGVGTFTATCSGGEDTAGNVAAPVSVTYTVSYGWSGFLPPVENGKVQQAGSTIPLKWMLTNAQNAAVGSLSSFVSITIQGCTGGTYPFATPGNSGLTYSNGVFQINWQTKGLAAGCYNVLLGVDDGTTKATTVQLKSNGK